MTRFLIAAILALSVSACANQRPLPDYWNDYGNSHGADANAGGAE